MSGKHLALIILAIPTIAGGDPSPAAVAGPQACPAIIRRTVTIDGRNDEWTSTGIKLQRDDIVLLTAEGKVKLDGWSNQWDAWGVSGEKSKSIGLGTLVMKVGTGEVRVAGASMFWRADLTGTLKLRIHDKDYRDNSGSFAVELTVIPASALPSPQAVADLE
jgi:hypothetical protein